MSTDKFVVPKVAMYNPVELKKILDLGLEEILKTDYKFSLDFWYSNTVIVCSFICSILGALAWYYPIPWPQSYWHIFAIIVIYIVVDGYLTYIMWYKHKGFVAQTLPKDKKPSMAFYSEMAKYSPLFVITKVADGKKSEVSFEVNKVFNEEGKLLFDLYGAYIQKLVN
ncbi:hypothetical protein EIN_047160 [Entamoeba invadens IP1]|uniref:Signal peptidase complex subunit 2 n=1 Tax=Entamoeba invadens IP1 TaxID=370355 RepID=A0A0A1UDC3_ENTIV|nr:hypothetical protein EIN_047160 [Entamoeba invadens IP1]ELP94433.1 hypothetical protein EIN_047160 [Entamoeba invadens IP1]|eukprot:XP_004261204.1 hypothetical protein EIN_047160 [Entamoeba invadens IP1]